MPTKPYTPSEAARPVALLGIEIPPAPRLPRGFLFVVGVPVSKASPRTITVEGELLSDRRVAS